MSIRSYLEAHPKKTEELDSLDRAMLANICPRLVEAQPINAEINESRRKCVQNRP